MTDQEKLAQRLEAFATWGYGHADAEHNTVLRDAAAALRLPAAARVEETAVQLDTIARTGYTVWGKPDAATTMASAAALLRRLSSSPAGDGWRPIASAPKDGTPILVYLPTDMYKPVREVWWALEYEGGPGYWSTPHGPVGRGYIILADSPTKWQPLPAPPTQEQEGGGK